MSGFCGCHLPYLDSPVKIRVADAENLLKQLKPSVGRTQCEYAAGVAYKLAKALQLDSQCAKGS